VVLITSAARAEGKTHFATSLAGSVGEEGGRSLLIDCDIYSKKRHRSFETLGDAQQTAYAASGVLLREDALPGVDIMAFRKRHEMPASQFDPDKLREIIELGRKRYDLIVLDAPPVLAVANTAVMAQAADGTIVVVHWNQTPSVAVTSAIRTLQAYGVRILGGVLTKVRPNELGKGEGAYGHAFRNISGYFKA
jgi:succinoglycan biosynthesis transport protein ExoP